MPPPVVQVHMRDHLTRHYRNLWVGSAALLRSQAAVIDNPDQRIEEDIAAFADSLRICWVLNAKDRTPPRGPHVSRGVEFLEIGNRKISAKCSRFWCSLRGFEEYREIQVYKSARNTEFDRQIAAM